MAAMWSPIIALILLLLQLAPSSSSYIQLPLQGNVHPVGYFYVTMEIGGKPYFLDVDTGSSLTWLECMHPNHQCKICKGPHLPYRPNGSLKKVNCADQFCVLISTKTYLIIRIVRVMLGSQTNATIMYGWLDLDSELHKEAALESQIWLDLHPFGGMVVDSQRGQPNEHCEAVVMPIILRRIHN
ncbi:hypothetical protein ZWY2020_047744 [Hordeum vulgare]|nr:hypothetical protein ZWY2020_047744 [Hordeum vulgare]